MTDIDLRHADLKSALEKHFNAPSLAGKGGFLWYYKQARGNPDFMSSYWKMRRTAFIRRFMTLYRRWRVYSIDPRVEKQLSLNWTV